MCKKEGCGLTCSTLTDTVRGRRGGNIDQKPKVHTFSLMQMKFFNTDYRILWVADWTFMNWIISEGNKNTFFTNFSAIKSLGKMPCSSKILCIRDFHKQSFSEELILTTPRIISKIHSSHMDCLNPLISHRCSQDVWWCLLSTAYKYPISSELS